MMTQASAGMFFERARAVSWGAGGTALGCGRGVWLSHSVCLGVTGVQSTFS